MLLVLISAQLEEEPRGLIEVVLNVLKVLLLALENLLEEDARLSNCACVLGVALFW